MNDIKKLSKFKKYKIREFFLGTLVWALYCYCGDTDFLQNTCYIENNNMMAKKLQSND